VPRLWEETIDAHRDAVREAVLRAAAGLVAEGGPTAVTMAELARRAGVGRATLYKYFPDTGSVLLAWHEAVVAEHLAIVRAAAAKDGPARERFDAALAAYVRAMGHRAQHPGQGEELHRAQHVAAGSTALVDLLSDLLTAAVTDGSVRADVPARELAEFCVAAAAAAPPLGSRAAASRLLAVVGSALDPPDRERPALN
jgi:AcrR family transcriptional regulator